MFSKWVVVTMAASLATGGTAMAETGFDWQNDGPGAEPAEYDYARVLRVEPQYRQVRVTVPRQECYAETRYLPDDRLGYGPERPAAGGMILGGLVGAVIGHQFGHGRDRNIGTVAGAVIGSAVGHDAAQRRGDGYGSQDRRPVSAERCETRYDVSTEQRIESYRVSYRYNGRNYLTELPYDPGQRLRVRVAVSPDGY